ncbi:MAG: type II toxin-antitoxin system RelE/ParE family toxin [Planctomycetes bacterium]|nr:type II toxin-antitoxin system RelE/ParE family toxin [Planctomycetota bacterium]
MRFEIVLAPTAVRELRALPAYERAQVRDALERHLRHEPRRVSRSRIRRLRGMAQPQFRLRVADIRIFYDVTETEVEVLAIVSKSQADSWLRERGKTLEEGRAGQG